MKVIAIKKDDWATGIAGLKDAYRVYGPVKGDASYEFKKLDETEMPDLACTNTRLSPKAVVFPQSEVMFEYTLDESKEGHHIMQEPPKDDAPRAVIGIRPCDAAAFLLVKQNFDTPEYQDPYWLKAYEATTLVGLGCAKPGSTCFCTSTGSGPFAEAGLDILLVDNGDHFLAKILTEKGERLAAAAGWQTEADAAATEATIGKLKTAAESAITSKVDTANLGARTILELYEAPFWEDVAFACINCGTCTFSCPTCWCFDIQDENRGQEGVRMRNWDSCMFPLFTLHGSGHNPRGEKLQRVRQRFMHKLKYFLDKYDSGIMCVGCGRCVRLCPVNIDIRKVAGLMNSYDPAACACPSK